ncbi:MAG: DUF3396 domain-containing protein [Gemmatimonadaceae bacterium]|jgi:hypothetical protein|nr:DUF3396 domain-containing protein [Gemmatimonadaceae bacterium]
MTVPITPAPDDLAALASALAPTDATGNVEARLALMATFYVMGGSDAPLKGILRECAEEFDGMIGDQLRWIAQSATGKWKEVKGGRRPKPGLLEAIDRAPAGSGWDVAMHAGPTRDSASDFACMIAASFAWKTERLHEASHVTVHLPIDYFAARSESFGDFVMRWATRLRPIHGYAGLGCALSVDPRVARSTVRNAFPFALRHPGLELDSPVFHSIAAWEGIKGVNWLTILDDDWVTRAGGADALRADLPAPSFTIRPYDGGLIIQAGGTPQMGDLNRRNVPMEYVSVARRLRALREPFIVAPTNAEWVPWLRRFDDVAG